MSYQAISLREHFDWVADNDEPVRRVQRDFHRQQLDLFRHHIPAGCRVLECGCGKGGLLVGLNPSEGVGLDLSPRMIALAKERYPANRSVEFKVSDVQADELSGSYDHVILNHLTGYLQDIQAVLDRLQTVAHPRTRLHLTSLNTVWDFPLRLGVKLGAVVRQPTSNWLSRKDLINLLELSGWEIVQVETAQLFPFNWPIVSRLFNDVLVKMPLFRHLGSTIFLTARPRRPLVLQGEISCSVVVPARNEAGNIRAALERIPVLGHRTEVIFVEGNSRDATWETIIAETAAYRGPHLVKYLKQPGKGKWDAVRTGLAQATGDVLVIQDADLTAPPEDLPKFFSAIANGTVEFANGSRLVYPMESQAMRFLNYLGNKFFASSLSFVLGQEVKDSLCGTKMILRADYVRLLERIKPFGDFDPFGDFNLLFGSSLLDLRIRDIPVRYKDRTYGATNISRFSHGWLLLKMTWFGLIRLKFFRR